MYLFEQDSGDSFPHLVNAGKYSTTLMKAAAQRQFRLQQNEFNFFLWIGTETFSSVYCLWWDLTQDWGLFEKSKSGGRRLLRNRLIYRNSFYYFGMRILSKVENSLYFYFQLLSRIQSFVSPGHLNCLPYAKLRFIEKKQIRFCHLPKYFDE